MGSKRNFFIGLFRRFYYAIALLLTFAIIFILFPKQGTFKYEFQKGKPWGHQTLIAPFDFPILKPNDILLVEKDSLFKGYVPYFVFDESIKASQIELLKKDLAVLLITQVEKKKREIISQIVGVFEELYDHGLLENAVTSYEALDRKDQLNFVKGNLATLVNKDQILSLKTAYLAIGEKLRALPSYSDYIVSLQSKIDFSKYLKPNLKFDESINKMRLEELLSSFSTTRGVIPADVRVISQGDMVTNENFLVLESLRQAYKQKRTYDGWISYNSFGQMVLIGALLAMLVVYLQSFNPQLFWKKRNFSLILTTLVLTFAMTRLIIETQEVNLYLLPVCILPIIIRTFLGSRNAIFIHLIAVLMIGFLAPNSFEFVFLQAIVGALAVISLNKFHKRGHLVITALLLIGAYSVLYFGFELVKEGDIKKINWNEFKWFAGSGLLLLIAYPLIYVFEKIFGLISDVTLMEMSDTNHPLLRLLSETAPGTFQHSMQVANLAEEVIRRTGGNPMLVRTGALYHDVGKILDAQYFIENQSPGENPHDKLPFKKSAEKIINHINDGVSLARKYKIPEIIIDFVRMHHGRSQARYFYLKYKQAHPDEEINMDEFMYPGPNPDSRETAVVMLADGVEAASRSLPEKNEETLKKIIDQIIDTRIQNRDLDSSPLTFKDIIDIKAIFLEKLKIIYHLRIQYPVEKE